MTAQSTPISGRAAGQASIREYLRTTHPAVLVAEAVRIIAATGSGVLALWAFIHIIRTYGRSFPLHVRLLEHPNEVTVLYLALLVVGVIVLALWAGTALRNFVGITLERANLGLAGLQEERRFLLPPWPAATTPGEISKRESFTVVLGELQDRSGERVPNDNSPNLWPRWLSFPELALYTGFFVTGAIGSGKTSAVIYPCMDQLISFRRLVPIRKPDGSVESQEWKFSGLVTDEKGDFTHKAAEFCKKWGRERDLIRISPGGEWIWNIVYNPNIPTWAIGYQLGWILKNFNKGQAGSDPFWENAPRELVTEYLGLLDDAESYYTIFDYLAVLVDDEKQDELYEKARRRFADNRSRLGEIERRWKSIERRRGGMGVNLRGSLEACARAGMDMFRQPELRPTFCPTREEYFEPDGAGNVRPRANVFTGFDQILDEGKIVGLDMPKSIYFDAAIFCQVALKTQWQDSVLRRESIGPDGKLRVPPRFGERIGYCPTFLMADEAQMSVTPRDAEFKAVCRSKRASVWEACQSHSSIRSTFGPNKSADADTFFQNSQTHIYLRQSDPTSMKTIQEELGKKLVAKTTVSVTEGGSSSGLSYFHGDIVHQGLGISSMKSVSTEEKPFLEIEELTTLPNNVAVVCPSNGHRTLPATKCYLRPLFVFENNPDLKRETSWLDWPDELKSTYDLHDIPQSITWGGWKTGPIDAAAVVTPESRLGKFVQEPLPVTVRPEHGARPPSGGASEDAPEAIGGRLAGFVQASAAATEDEPDELPPIVDDDDDLPASTDAAELEED